MVIKVYLSFTNGMDFGRVQLFFSLFLPRQMCGAAIIL